ncbi:cytochrome P450 [Mycena albidolilacea]|uniref:Cytochrome P450 n=1 Tax=Mycena albidolilacea TaxID=1033008 RepID=A0AAD6ZMA5_9AGAR|nr:cytochrome P450 [Mycena albidolilacea]
MISQLLIPIAGTILFYVLFHALSIVYRELTSPLRYMAGPKTRSLLLGNSQEMMEDPNLTDRWRSEFGATFRFKGVFGISELHTSDIKAINHVISKSNVYRRAPFARARSGQLTGNGILSVDLDDHKRFNPVFGVAQMRVITEVFVEKAIQLRDIWAQQVRDNQGTVRIEVVSWLRLMTLEIIGKAGFNYDFDALVPDKDKKPNDLNEVLKQILHSPLSNRYAIFRLAQSLPLPGKSLFLAARTEMFSIGHRILASSKADIVASEGEKNLGGKRDLLSTLLKTNLSPDVPANQRLSDRELVSQIPTFFVAGHETTSTAASWALHALSQNIIAQTKLRKELLTVSTDNPTMDELNSLPYLESVVQETLRIHSPVTFRHRMAMEEDVLPLSKPYVDKEGKPHDSLVIPKGQIIYIPILAVNTDKDIWGPDAREWKPERWETIPDEVGAIPTVWGNILTFFAGPHNCVGSRFAILALKAMLFTIIRAFEVEKAVPEGGIGRTAESPLRPIVLAEGNRKSSLPLILKAYDVHGV